MLKSKLTKKVFDDLKRKMDEGLFPQWALTDPEIYELEVEKIFGRTWHFLGHESELKEPGSFVTRWIVNDPVLLLKNKDGKIKAFLNSCTHRGALLCAEDYGCKKAFTCPYHGWTFNLDGELIGIAAGDRVYGAELVREEWALRPIPRVETYQGLIFGNLDPKAVPLEEYLGGMTWYLDMMLGRSDGGMEVRGMPHRWVVAANWKATSENFAADPYHVLTTHRSTVELGITPAMQNKKVDTVGHQVILENGHGINVSAYLERPPQPYQRMPKSMWPMFERNLSPEQNDLLSRAHVLVGGIYPNLSFVSPLHGTEGELHNYLSFRVWRPMGPDKVEVWSWFLIDKEAPEEYKKIAYKGYIGSFGVSGTLEQDDTVIWSRMVQASKGLMVRDKQLSYNNLSNYLMGYQRVEPDPSFIGPGVAYPSIFLDFLARSMHQQWYKYITDGLFI